MRLAIALGDAAREQRVLPTLEAAEDDASAYVIEARCLTADELLDAVDGGRVDAAVVAIDLHRLSEEALTRLRQAGIPVVFVAPGEAGAHPWQSVDDVVPLSSNADAVRRALDAAVGGKPKARRHGRVTPGGAPTPTVATENRNREDELTAGEAQTPRRAPPSHGDTAVSDQLAGDSRPVAPETGPAAAVPPAAGSVILITSGHGSHGRTTVALNLAAALGMASPSLLVDLDVSGPSVAACLNGDPTRNLYYLLAYSGSDSPRQWDRAIEEETQPIHPHIPYGRMLCGVPKPGMGGAIAGQS
ncbi:MAG: hypothetical protein M3442_16415, partial [Chloroflexota bacterium]|nr:hypothetical protein [Chloroflexota bacterium]